MDHHIPLPCSACNCACILPATQRCLDCLNIAICDGNSTLSSSWYLSDCRADTMRFPTIEKVSLDWSCESRKLESPSITCLKINCTPKKGTQWAEDWALPIFEDCRLSLGDLPKLAELQLVYTLTREKVTFSCLTKVLHAMPPHFSMQWLLCCMCLAQLNIVRRTDKWWSTASLTDDLRSHYLGHLQPCPGVSDVRHCQQNITAWYNVKIAFWHQRNNCLLQLLAQVPLTTVHKCAQSRAMAAE